MAPPATSRGQQLWFDRSAKLPKNGSSPLGVKKAVGGQAAWPELPPIGGDLGNDGSSASLKVASRTSPRSASHERPVIVAPLSPYSSGGQEQSQETPRDALGLYTLSQDNIWGSTTSLAASLDSTQTSAINWQPWRNHVTVLNTAMPGLPPSVMVRPLSPARPRQTRASPKGRARTEEGGSARHRHTDNKEVVRNFLQKQGSGGKDVKDDSTSESESGPASGKAEPSTADHGNAPKGSHQSKSRQTHQRNSLLHIGAPSVTAPSDGTSHHGAVLPMQPRESSTRRSKFGGDGNQLDDSLEGFGRRETVEAPMEMIVSEDLQSSLAAIRRKSQMNDPTAQQQETPRTGSKSILHASLAEQVWRASENQQGVRKNFQFKPNKPPLSARMRRLEIRRSERVKQLRSARQHELKRRQFEELPAKEIEALQVAFSTFDEDRSGYLDSTEVMYCLREFGLAGANPEEKREIMAICFEATTASAERGICPHEDPDSDRKAVAIDLLELALTVVPRVRHRLLELRGDDLLKQFFKYDLDDRGKLSKGECLELARDMGLDPRVITESIGGQDEVDFELFQDVIAKGREHVQRCVRDRERACQRRMQLPEASFQDFRDDVVSLHDIFVRYDKDESGTLSKVEMKFMLKEFGLQSTTPQEKQAIEGVLRPNEQDEELNFLEFLDVVRKIRKLQQDKRRDQQMERFCKYDKDKSGNLSHAEISMLLGDLGFVPTTRKEQDELAYLISSVDADGSGCLDFVEFQTLCQRVDEKLKSFRYEEEVEFAMRLGFTEKQMRDLRWVFDSLDIDGSNKLDATEVRNGLVMMRKHVSTESFESSFRALDKDGSGELDFTEFLSFMRMMRDGEGMSAEETQKLAAKPKNLDTRILRRVLEYFRLARQYINSLGHEDLVNLFCEYFKCSPTANLHDALDVRTVGELYEAAKTRNSAMQSYSL